MLPRNGCTIVPGDEIVISCTLFETSRVLLTVSNTDALLAVEWNNGNPLIDICPVMLFKSGTPFLPNHAVQ